MNIDPIHIGQVALANALVLSIHQTARIARNTQPVGRQHNLALHSNARRSNRARSTDV